MRKLLRLLFPERCLHEDTYPEHYGYVVGTELIACIERCRGCGARVVRTK